MSLNTIRPGLGFAAPAGSHGGAVQSFQALVAARTLRQPTAPFGAADERTTLGLAMPHRRRPGGFFGEERAGKVQQIQWTLRVENV